MHLVRDAKARLKIKICDRAYKKTFFLNPTYLIIWENFEYSMLGSEEAHTAQKKLKLTVIFKCFQMSNFKCLIKRIQSVNE